MSFRPILTVACILIVIYHVVWSDSSNRSRAVIASLTTVSFILPEPAWTVVNITVQLGVSLFVLLRLQVDL